MPSYGSAGLRGDGSSSNTGNQIGNRSSTRVHQQPGGNSTFSLGWGDPSNATKVPRHQPTYAPAPQQGGASVFGTNSYAPPVGSFQSSNSAHHQQQQRFSSQAPPQNHRQYGRGNANSYASSGNFGNAPPNATRGPVPMQQQQPRGYSQNDYIPRSLNTSAVAAAPGNGDALDSVAGGGLSASPMSRRREHAAFTQHLQNKPVSPKVARAAEAASRRSGVGYGSPSPTRAAANAYGQRASRVSSNSYANGASQNSGNVITNRSSTRVAQQPGGNSSFSIGWGGSGGADNRFRAPKHQQHHQPAPAPAPAPVQQHYGTQSSNSNYGVVKPAGGFAFGVNMDRQRGSSNAFANGTNQNVGNFISERSSTRIHAPPGGRSSLTFG